MNGTDILPEDLADEQSYNIASKMSNPKAPKQFLPRSQKPMPDRLTDSSDDNDEDIFRSNDSAFNFDNSFVSTSENSSLGNPVAGTSGAASNPKKFNFKKPAPIVSKLSRSLRKSQKKWRPITMVFM